MSDTTRLDTSAAMLVVAAGRGNRMGAERPKQYLDLGGVPVLRRTIEACLSAPEVARLLVVIHPDDTALYDAAVAGIADARLLSPVAGAETRAGSVRAGLRALSGEGPARVLIHDAARPFISRTVIARVLAALDYEDGAFAALPVVDALWRVGDGHALAPVPRDQLWRAQTPQAFDLAAIRAAHDNNAEDAADDVAIARAAGMTVAAVEGEETNFKITTAADLARAREMIQRRRE